MRVFAWFAVLALVLVSSATDAAGPTCSAYQQRVAPNSPQCFEAATSLQDDDIVYGVQGTGPTRSNQSVKIPVSQLRADAAAAAPVQSVAGRVGIVTLSTSDVSGLGSMATQSDGGVAITGGTISGVTIGGIRRAITTLSSPTYTTLTSDGFICVNASSNTAITLVNTPPPGTTQIITDCSGTASTYQITISPQSGLILGLSGVVINQAYMSLTLVYTGTGWVLQ